MAYVVEGFITSEEIEQANAEYRKAIEVHKDSDEPEKIEFVALCRKLLDERTEPYWLGYYIFKRYPQAKYQKGILESQQKSKKFRVVKAEGENLHNYKVIPW